MSKIINIAGLLPPTVTTRKAVGMLETAISFSGNDEVVFNFEAIDFISRAFADELIHFVHNKGIKARFVNINPVVAEMLNVVEKNRNGRNRQYHNIAITNFSQKQQLHHLLSII
jgi:anti-anti-sigma regulatory factor